MGDASIPQLRKREWPAYLAGLLGIEPVPGSVAPFVSNGDTTAVIWFERACAALRVPYPGERVKAMELLVERVGQTWDPVTCSSVATRSGGGGNIKKEAFRRFYKGLTESRPAPSTGGTASQDPDWTWDERLLVFDLYLRRGAVGPDHEDVRAVSDLLRQLPIHEPAKRTPTFRDPNAVVRKLTDIQACEPGDAGKLDRRSPLDAEMWERFGSDHARVRSVAEAIRAGAGQAGAVEEDEAEIEELHREGRITYRVHRRRERDPELRRRKIQEVRRKLGRLQCEACDAELEATYGKVGNLVFECHHLQPLHATGERDTGLRDVALLCPTCHRVAHRMNPWPTLADLRDRVRR